MRRRRRRTLATVLTRLPPSALRASVPFRFAGRCSAPLAAACSVLPPAEKRKKKGEIQGWDIIDKALQDKLFVVMQVGVDGAGVRHADSSITSTDPVEALYRFYLGDEVLRRFLKELLGGDSGCLVGSRLAAHKHKRTHIQSWIWTLNMI
uniref:Uncharacterized protein n=1 Tax=Oryza meridionalis TaxID=40149 RepID=A0A0E0CYQ2_9ORYZ